MNPTSVTFSDKAINNWFEIIREAADQGLLVQLIERALAEYPKHEMLRELLVAFKSLGLTLKPAETEIQQDEVEFINLPLVQKEGGYVIDEPPADWIVKELTLGELLSQGFGTDLSKGDSNIQFVDVDRFDKREILWVSSKARVQIEYDPGVSLINGRRTFVLVPQELPVVLLKIMPLERNSAPPAFLQQSFEHNFMAQLAGFLPHANLKSSFASTTKNTNRLRLTAELDQRIENVIVDGNPNQSLTTNQTLIGIQGLTRDYLLILSYISQATLNKAEIETQMAFLKKIVDSFKPIKPTNVEAEERQLLASGDKRYKKYIELKAGEAIRLQYGFLAKQWSELDWDKAESRERLIREVKRVQQAIKVFKVEELNSLSQRLDEIANMAPSEIKALLTSGNEEQPQSTDRSVS